MTSSALRSNIRLAYFVSFGLTIISFIALMVTVAIEGEGQVSPEIAPYSIAAAVGLVVGLNVTLFVVRCGNCKTRLFSLMSGGLTRRGTVQYEGDVREAFKFMAHHKCPACDIKRN